MKEPITRYVEDRYAKLNEFVSMQPDMSELPDFEKEKGKLPEPVWAGHDDEIAAYYKAWEIAFRNLGKPTKESGFVSPYIDAAFNGHIFMWDSCFMLMFGKYGDSVHCFQKTLDNFYCKQHKDGFICREINELDGVDRFYRHDPTSTGPEIMAWCEWQYYKTTETKTGSKKSIIRCSRSTIGSRIIIAGRTGAIGRAAGAAAWIICRAAILSSSPTRRTGSLRLSTTAICPG